MKNKSFILPITKNTFRIVDFMQDRLTITGHLRRKELLSERVRTLNNLVWLFISTVLALSKPYSCNVLMFFILTLPIYRLWEIFIINIWMFVFLQSAEKPNRCTSLEANVRLFILLMVQYATIILMYAFIYKCIFSIFPNSFYTSKELVTPSPSALAWIYHSLGVMTNQSYGIIQPASDLSRSITASQIIFGLSYMLLFISTVLSNFKFYWRTPRKVNFAGDRRLSKKR